MGLPKHLIIATGKETKIYPIPQVSILAQSALQGPQTHPTIALRIKSSVRFLGQCKHLDHIGEPGKHPAYSHNQPSLSGDWEPPIRLGTGSRKEEKPMRTWSLRLHIKSLFSESSLIPMKPTALALHESIERTQSLWALCSLPPIVEPEDAAHIQPLDISSARNQGDTPQIQGGAYCF